LGRRVQKTVSSVVSKFVYDSWNTAQEKTSNNKIAFNELDGLSLDQVFSRTPASGTASYLLTDALSSTVGLADTSGVVQTSYTYEPFGKTTSSGAASTNPFQFTGRENDSTGTLALYNYRARSYSPALQRFLTEDPIGFVGGEPNLYMYVANGATYQRDPMGLLLETSGSPLANVTSGRKDAVRDEIDLLGNPLAEGNYLGSVTGLCWSCAWDRARDWAGRAITILVNTGTTLFRAGYQSFRISICILSRGAYLC
jgi:RHS repeat-associated protein